jgi:23S rRNA (uridine2552-2'-O)-methyltransferase
MSSSVQWLSRHSRDPFVKLRAASSYRSRAAFKLLQIDDMFRIFGGGHIPGKTKGKSKGNVSIVRPGVVVDIGAAPGGWSQVAAERLARKSAMLPRPKAGKPSDEFSSSSREIGSRADSEEEASASLNCQSVLTQSSLIIALDILPMDPISGVHTLQKDFLAADTSSLLAKIIRDHHSLLSFTSEAGSDTLNISSPTAHVVTPKPEVDLILSDMAPNISGNRTRDNALMDEMMDVIWSFTWSNLRRSSLGVGVVPGGALV